MLWRSTCRPPLQHCSHHGRAHSTATDPAKVALPATGARSAWLFRTATAVLPVIASRLQCPSTHHGSWLPWLLVVATSGVIGTAGQARVAVCQGRRPPEPPPATAVTHHARRPQRPPVHPPSARAVVHHARRPSRPLPAVAVVYHGRHLPAGLLGTTTL